MAESMEDDAIFRDWKCCFVFSTNRVHELLVRISAVSRRTG